MGCSSSNVEETQLSTVFSEINKKSLFFTLKGENTSDSIFDDGPSQLIEIFIFLKNVEHAKYYIEMKIFDGDFSRDKKTEELEGSEFDPFYNFQIKYLFETDQIIQLNIFKNSNFFINFSYSIGKLMGSQGQIAKFPLIIDNIYNGNLIIRAQNIKNDNYEATLKVLLYARNKNTNLEPYFYLQRKFSNADNTVINAYKSEILNNQANNYYDFSTITIKTLYLNNNISTQPFRIEFYDSIINQKIGYQNVEIDSFSKLNGNRNKYFLRGPNDQQENLKYELTISLKDLKKLHKFIDFLRGGLQISMIVGIDFTSSNKQIDDPNSLHYFQDNVNKYEKAIISCAKIVSNYDYDQKIPVFGYGAVIDDSDQVNHCFAINFQKDPNINKIENIVKTYRECLKRIKLYGPTYFAPIIKKAIEIAKITSNNKDVYYILMILTDGQINDMNETVKKIIDCCDLPLSIIIVGVGNADFSNMEILDGVHFLFQFYF